MISADLLLKGLAGTAAVAGAATMAVFHQRGIGIFAKNKVETFTLEQLADKVGLVCKGTPTATAGIECSKKEGTNVKVNVKKDSKFELDSLGSAGKIKVYKTSTSETYNNDHKFVIEEGDISGEADKKLEEFETYEIKKEGDDWRLTRKDKASVLKGKLLGLSGVDTCKLPKDSTEATCSNLTAEDLKKIKFDGKTEGGDVTIEPAEGTTTITLKISKVTEAPFDTGGYKFVLETNKNISIPKSNGAITIKKGTNTEFKLKTTTATGGGAKTLTLEKAWSLNDLAAKVGLKNCGTGSGTPKECGFETSTKVNLFNDSGNYTKGASVASGDASKKIKVEEDQENHNQGFKFYAEENSEITLENGNPNKGNDKKIAKKDTSTNLPTYEIKQQTVGEGGTKDWYLSKKTAAN